ncbi:MAG: cell division protein SepF [Thermoplasmata archaeon]
MTAAPMGTKTHFKKQQSHVAGEQQYLDLGAMHFGDENIDGHHGASIKVAEIYRFEDLKHLTKHLYDGHTLLIDYSSIANDELAIRRISAELQSVAADVRGDVAGVGKNLLVVTSNGLVVDRNKIRGSY